MSWLIHRIQIQMYLFRPLDSCILVVIAFLKDLYYFQKIHQIIYKHYGLNKWLFGDRLLKVGPYKI